MRLVTPMPSAPPEAPSPITIEIEGTPSDDMTSRFTAKDLSGFGIIDEIVPEPAGGAHRDVELTVSNVGDAIRRHLAALKKLTPEQLVVDRYKKYRVMGVFTAEE